VRPIRYAGADFGTVDLVLRRNALDAALASARALLIVLSAIVMSVAAIVGYVGAAAVTRPLSRLRDALDTATSSDFALRISHRRRDEFGAVFDAFNRAADAVEPRLGATRSVTDMLATRIEAGMTATTAREAA
jgi:serine/threonine-protein kinase